MSRFWEDAFGEPEPPLPTPERVREDQRRMNLAHATDDSLAPENVVASVIDALAVDVDWIEDIETELHDDGLLLDVEAFEAAKHRIDRVHQLLRERKEREEPVTWDELRMLGDARRRYLRRINAAVKRMRD